MAAGRVDRLVREVFALEGRERAGFLCKVEVRAAQEAFLSRRAELRGPGRCPRCGCAESTRRGRDARGRQRWLCKGCGRSFTLDTGGVVSRSHLPAATWAAFARCHAAQATLRDTAAECGVSLKTARCMRMRVRGMLRLEVTSFTTGPDDSAQGDEAFLPESFSGNHGNDPGLDPWRLPRSRGGGVQERETLLTCVGSDGSADIRVFETPEVSTAAFDQIKAVAHKGTRVACDQNSSVGAAARRLGLEVEELPAASHAPDAVNCVHSSLKRLVRRFRGLSSRRMQRYMWWFCWREGRSARGGGARAQAADPIDLLAVGRYRTTRRQMFSDPYPVEGRLERKRAEAASKMG